MFESVVGEPQLLAAWPSSRLASAIEENHRALMAQECRQVELAAAWADAHVRDAMELESTPLLPQAKLFGGPGTPPIDEFCVDELATLVEVSATSAQILIADALDLRWRWPRLWVQLIAGQVRAWQARKIAALTRRLSAEACAELDETWSGRLRMLPWGRFFRLISAAVLDADPDQAAERETRARQARDVLATDSEDGLKLILARAVAGDAVWFLATINRLADLLGLEGDADPVGVRRSKAIGIIAQPAKALEMLARHRHDPDPDEDQPGASAPEPPTDQPATDEPATDDYESLTVRPPTPAESRAARPRVVLVFHLADAALRASRGLVRPEHGEAIALNQLKAWLADTGCAVTVRPTWRPAEEAPVDAYEIPQRLRDAIRLRDLADVFPYGSCTTATMDLDHTRPYVPMIKGGPPGQTSLAGLGPMTRHHHRTVTHGGWQKTQPAPGQFVFRSPTGRVYLVTNNGTQPLGTTPFAQRVWRAASRAAPT